MAAGAAEEHDLDGLSVGVLAGRSGAAEELNRILASVPPISPPSAPRVAGTGSVSIPTVALDAILDPNRPVGQQPSVDKRALSKAHVRLLAASAVAGRGDDRLLLGNSIAALSLVHRLRVLEQLGTEARRDRHDDPPDHDLNRTARGLEYAGHDTPLSGYPAPRGLDAPSGRRNLLWDIAAFDGYAEYVRAARNAEVISGPHDDRIAFDPPQPCEGQPVRIAHTTGLWNTRTITGVRFSSRRNVASLPAEFAVVDNEILVHHVPVGSVSGPVAIDLAPGDAFVKFKGVRVNLEPGGTTYARFRGGMTALFLVWMRPQESWRRGLVAGGQIDVAWEASNVDKIRGEIVGGSSTIRFRVDSSAGDAITPGGRQRVRLADSTRRHELRCTLTGRGPCGSATSVHATATACRSERLVLGAEEAFAFADGRFANWHHNIARPARVASPEDVEELIRAVRTAERDGARLGVKGTACSYTDIVSPAEVAGQRIVELYDFRSTSLEEINAQRRLLRKALRDEVESVLDADVQEAYLRHTHLSRRGRRLDRREREAPSLTDVRVRLVPVRAGTKFSELNWLLDQASPRLALATLGGGTVHSLAGAFATGTHGATFNLPPPCDFVRAIRVIAARGRVWWVEPARNPITSEARLIASGLLEDVGDECVQIVYDDELFDALLVSVGCGGIISDFVIETVDAHMMSRTVQERSWTAARPEIDSAIRQIIGGASSRPEDGLPALWFYGFSVVSSGKVWIDQQSLDSTRLPPPGPPRSPGPVTGEAWFPVALGALLGELVSLPVALGLVIWDITIEIAELIGSVLFPWEWDNIDDQWRDLQDALASLGELAELATATLNLVQSASDPDDQVAALAAGLNLLWTLTLVPFLSDEFGLDVADHILETIARDQLSVDKPQPERNFIMLADGETGTKRNHEQSTEGTLIISREFGVPAAETLSFVDALMDGMARLREGGDAAIMVANIRFTRNTHATIGMQQFAPLTGHIEVYTARGLDGTSAAHAMIDSVAARFAATPHWGQVHNADLAVNAYAWKRSWANAMSRLDPEGVGTFRRDFVADRGLY